MILKPEQYLPLFCTYCGRKLKTRQYYSSVLNQSVLEMFCPKSELSFFNFLTGVDTAPHFSKRIYDVAQPNYDPMTGDKLAPKN